MTSQSSRVRKRQPRAAREDTFATPRRSARLQARADPSTPRTSALLEQLDTTLEAPHSEQASKQLLPTLDSVQPTPVHKSLPPQLGKRRAFEPVEDTPAKRPRAALTKENLRKLDTMGQKRKPPVPGFGSEKSAKLTAESSATTTATRKTTTTEKQDFARQLRTNHIITGDMMTAKSPLDSDDILEKLDHPRDSPPPEEELFAAFKSHTRSYVGELDVEVNAFSIFVKRVWAREISGYQKRCNHPWNAIDNHITRGISPARPDIAESFRAEDYPQQALDDLGYAMIPTQDYYDTMPALAIEFKKPSADFEKAQMQCTYDGALMVEGARVLHLRAGRPVGDFYGKTHAITIAFNGKSIEIYSHHAEQTVPGDNEKTLRYHQTPLITDNPKMSLAHFRLAWKHIRNAQDLGYVWASQRKDELWAYKRAIDRERSELIDAISNDMNIGAPASPPKS